MSRRPQPGWTAQGVVEAPVERVWQQLLATTPGLPDQGWQEPHEPYHISAGAGRITIEIDPRAYTIAIQGEWWYRGVYSVAAYAHGSLLRYSVHNIAPGSSWWAAQLLQGPQHAREMRQLLEQRLLEIAARTGGKAYLLD